MTTKHSLEATLDRILVIVNSASKEVATLCCVYYRSFVIFLIISQSYMTRCYESDVALGLDVVHYRFKRYLCTCDACSCMTIKKAHLMRKHIFWNCGM